MLVSPRTNLFGDMGDVFQSALDTFGHRPTDFTEKGTSSNSRWVVSVASRISQAEDAILQKDYGSPIG
jgi:hypothetical protein